MTLSKLLLASAASFVLLASAALDASADTKGRRHHRHYVRGTGGCPVHQIADGSLVDCHGWRKWSGSIGWDNTCFNLDYMPSQFACSARGGRR
jgi:hypothetical protein